MTQLAKSLEQLYTRRTFGIKLGLQTEQALLAHLDNPQNSYAIVHVAGTNGKGSVCAMLESVLRSAGIRTGLYTSPHLVQFNERFLVNGIPITNGKLAQLVARIEQLAHTVSAETGNDPTFFECSTAIALEHFRNEKIRIALLETGMGGRLDATNICTPLISVITKVSIEHTEHLGPDIESIATEKAGIIKQDIPVVCGATHETALQVITALARKRNAPVLHAPDHVSARLISGDITCQKVSVESAATSYGTISLPLLGPHQIENLCTAIAAIESLAQVIGIDFTPEQVKHGIAATKWPGRFQAISTEPPIILDGAHNPGAGDMLVKTLKKTFGNKPIGLVLGMCDDKDAVSFLKPFAGIVKKLWIVPLQNERNMESERIVSAAASLGLTPTKTTSADALAQSKLWATETNGAACITGSLFLVGEVLSSLPKMSVS